MTYRLCPRRKVWVDASTMRGHATPRQWFVAANGNPVVPPLLVSIPARGWALNSEGQLEHRVSGFAPELYPARGLEPAELRRLSEQCAVGEPMRVGRFTLFLGPGVDPPMFMNPPSFVRTVADEFDWESAKASVMEQFGAIGPAGGPGGWDLVAFIYQRRRAARRKIRRRR